MTKLIRYLLVAAIMLSVLTVFAVSLHSVDEIHYLKSFYPSHLTVEEAFYAASVEFIKIHLISLPLVLLIFICLFFLWLYRKE